ncbi:MAG: CheR family methyltransferase [Chlamydiota bacterium]|nr:CheR family methyltransferase [Chlamydiota bacterium]
MINTKMPDLIFEQFQYLLIEEAGLYFAKDRTELLADNIQRRMKHISRNSYEEYFHYIKFHPQGVFELKELIDDVTINETYFFRNEAQFQVLRDVVLMQLLDKKKVDKQITIWTAGCSTGEEPYSIMMLLLDLIPDYDDWDITVLATDINRKVIEAAKNGCYTQRAVHLVPPHFMSRYFTFESHRYWISSEVKRRVTFQCHNLSRDPYTLQGMQQADVIFCRNVIIYFNRATQKTIVSNFADCLSLDGFLFLGHAETLWGLSNELVPVEFPHTFIYQKCIGVDLTEISPPHIPLPSMSFSGWDDDPFLPEVGEKIETVEAIIPLLETVTAEELSQIFIRALSFADKGQYQEAILDIEKIIENDSLNVKAYYLMGVLKEKLGLYRDAVQAFRKAIYVDENIYVAYFHLGNLYMYLGKSDKARKEYINCMKILKERPEDEPVMLSEDMTVGVLYNAVEQYLI